MVNTEMDIGILLHKNQVIGIQMMVLFTLILVIMSQVVITVIVIMKLQVVANLSLKSKHLN